MCTKPLVYICSIVYSMSRVGYMPDHPLTLDLETIYRINKKLARLCENMPLEKVHGSFTVRIVKGQFQTLETTDSELLNDQKTRNRNIA